jgi:predicted HTH transcriptional regulator
MGFCEERGSGIDKIIASAEDFQLPPPEFTVKTQSFVATVFAPRSYRQMSLEERVRACYQHACLLWVSGQESVTNSTLRQRFGLPSSQSSYISRLFSEALERRVIKPAPGSGARAKAAYVPYWA